MEYFIAVVMGYFLATNGVVERGASQFVGMRYTNRTLATMSALGGWGTFICLLPAAYFVGSDYGNGFLQGFLFCVAALGGAILSGAIKVPGFRHLISAFTLPVTIAFAVLVYGITRS